MAPVTTRAILLRGHDYGDSSRILRFYTEDHGLLSVVARGVRGRSGKGSTVVSSFASGELVAYVKAQRDLHTMKDFACKELRDGLSRDVARFAGAACLAELVLSHAEQEPHAEVFTALETGLDRVSLVEGSELTGVILASLWGLIGAFGFGPQLDPCVLCARAVGQDEVGRFDLSAGGVRCSSCAEGAAGPRIGPIARAQLRELLGGRVPSGFSHGRQHLGLVSDFIACHVVSKPLKSLPILGELLPRDGDVPA